MLSLAVLATRNAAELAVCQGADLEWSYLCAEQHLNQDSAHRHHRCFKPHSQRQHTSKQGPAARIPAAAARDPCRAAALGAYSAKQ